MILWVWLQEVIGIQAQRDMHMGHMRIFIIIAIANTFTMNPLSLWNLLIEAIILLVLYPVKGQLYFRQLVQKKVLPLAI